MYHLTAELGKNPFKNTVNRLHRHANDVNTQPVSIYEHGNVSLQPVYV